MVPPMALTTCPECDGRVSDSATSCPHCGYPVAEKSANASSEITTPTAPGWYKDPAGQASHEAYWDGEKWTGATRQPGSTAAQQPSTMARPWLFAAGAFLILGSFLPWAQAGIFSLSGTSGDGVLTLMAGVVVGLLGIVQPKNVVPGAVALVASIGSVWVVWNVFDNFSDTPENIGAGILVTGLGGILGVVGGIRALDDRNTNQ